MEILYKAKFLGQGFSIPTNTIVDVVAEIGDEVVFCYGEYSGFHIPKHIIEKVE